MKTITQLGKIKRALLKAGFEIAEKNELLMIECPRYTVSCYYSEEFGRWRLTPYDDHAERIIQEAIHE